MKIFKDDPIKMQMSQFLSVQQNQNEIGLNNAKVLDAKVFKNFYFIFSVYYFIFCTYADVFLFLKIFETVEQIQQFKTQREFFLGFSQNPQDFIQKWLISQCRDLKVSSNV